MRHPTAATLGAVILAASFASPGHAETPAAPLGLVDGKPAPYACFTRHYDAAHLASHPKQNVKDMAVLIAAYADQQPDFPQWTIIVSVHFRGHAQRFAVSGSCSLGHDPGQLLACGVDCDGGRIGIRQKGSDELLLDIPEGARVGNEDEVVPKTARFGSDDKTFLLNRVSARDCLALTPDPDLKALIRKGK
ncbi:MAG: hypothetical protein P4L98_21165 [Ancalomicrobiaceae bacterium]|nr:hypothetical protein [Ancalomicrobiaceae bacterium]